MKRLLISILLLPMFVSSQQITDSIVFRFANGDIKYFIVRTVEAANTTDSIFVSHNGTRAVVHPIDLPINTLTQTALNGKQASGSYLIAADIVGKANVTSASLVTPNIGAATGTSLSVTGAITSSGGGIGYTTGNGGTVLQNTNKSTGVTLNKLSGEITLNGAALAANTTVSFTFTNSTIATTDVIILNHSSAGTAGSYALNGQCGNGTAAINVRNVTSASLSQAIVIRFVVIKGSTN